MKIREHVGQELWTPRGMVTVELRDAETGRLHQREQGENFLTLDTLEVARWYQRMMWGAFNPVAPVQANFFTAKQKPLFPADHIAVWNDSSAESPSTEHRPEKPLVAWASRWPVGSPSGKRGVVNITESEFTDEHSKWVFDWVTSQGNGTFQSVGWTMISEALGLPTMRWPETDLVQFVSVSTVTYSSGGLHWDGTYWYSLEPHSAPKYQLIRRDADGTNPTVVFDIPTTAFNPAGGSPHWPIGLTKIGTDWFLGGINYNSGKGRIAKLNSSGAQQWANDVAALAAGEYVEDITSDGTDLFIVTGTAGNKIYRCDPASGAVVATITPTWSVGTGPLGIAYDATDGNFWVLDMRFDVLTSHYQLTKMDATGVIVGPQMALNLWSYLTQASTSPYSGYYVIPYSAMRDQSGIGWHASNTGGGGMEVNSNTYPGGAFPSVPIPASANIGVNVGTFRMAGVLCVRDDDVYVGPAAAFGGYYKTWGAVPLRGHCLGTRVLLGSPVTKTNLQTMKITYEFDFT